MRSARDLFRRPHKPATPAGLVLTLAGDFPQLRHYLGEVRFAEMARNFAARHSARLGDLAWFSRQLPEFLAATKLSDHKPELAELASLEQALADALATPAVASIGLAELLNLSRHELGLRRLRIAPSARRFAVASNVTSLWASLTCGEPPPHPIMLEARQQLLVWRQGLASRYRMLGDEEAMALDAAIEGKRFDAIRALLAGRDDPDGAARRTFTYLRGWVDGELVTYLLKAPDGGGNTPDRRA